MGTVRINKGMIPQIKQTVLVGANGTPSRDLWCSLIDRQAGLGGTSAQFELPTMLADQVGYKFADQKVEVKCGNEQTQFIGYLSAQSEDISASTDHVSMQAWPVTKFLGHVHVGEGPVDADQQWHFKYNLINEKTGLATGWTPAAVIYDLFLRLALLPQPWITEIALGSMESITMAHDLPVASFDFSLVSYADALNMIVDSLGDVTIRERFFQGVCYLDFVRISSPVAPVSTVTVAERGTPGIDANVARIGPQIVGDEVVNRVVCFGQDKEFCCTSKSYVDYDMDWNGQTIRPLDPPVSESNPLTRLEKDWDPALNALVLKDPKLASGKRTVKVKAMQYPGDPAPEGAPAVFEAGATQFNIESGILLIAGVMGVDGDGLPEYKPRVILTAPNGEKLAVDGVFSGAPEIKADPDAVPPVAGKAAQYQQVHVIRNYDAPADGSVVPDDMPWDTPLDMEIVGVKDVFRKYRLPKSLLAYPKKEIQSDLPILDIIKERPDDDPDAEATEVVQRQRMEPQIIMWRTKAAPKQPDILRVYSFMATPSIVEGAIQFDKHCVILDEPAVVPISSSTSTTTVGGKEKKVTETTYVETVVGVTFSFFNGSYGWDTGAFLGNTALPWGIHTSRLRLEEFGYAQTTNAGYPLTITDPATGLPVEITFGFEFVHPKTGKVHKAAEILRNEVEFLRRAAERELSQKYRRHVSYDIDIPWLDVGYQIGNRLNILGLKRQPAELLFVTGVTMSMPVEGDHSTSLIVDNARPPRRRSYSHKFKKAI